MASLRESFAFEPESTHGRHGSLVVGGLALVLLIALGDYATGYDLRLAILYLVPIAVVTWRRGRFAGMLVSAAAATTWLLTFRSSHHYASIFYLYWEAALATTTYVLFVFLIARLREALARSDERFVTVLEELQAAVFAEELATGKLLYANRRFRDVYGRRRPWRSPPPELAGEIFDEPSARWYWVRGRKLEWVDGRAAVLYILSDVTEEKRSHELMVRNRDAVHRTSRLISLGEFASTMAHELNQPLAAISTYNGVALRLLESGSFNDGELRDTIRKSGEQAQRAGRIMQRLRELLRQPGPQLVAHDLQDIAAEALRLIEPEAREAGVATRLLPTTSHVPVLVDGVLMEQVVVNLLRNAIEATRNIDAGRRQAVMATAVRADGRASLAVTDWGEGVPPAIAPRLFEPFVTARPGGLGLGLSICRSVIEAHDGTIAYRPNDEGGSVFELTLPVRPA